MSIAVPIRDGILTVVSAWLKNNHKAMLITLNISMIFLLVRIGLEFFLLENSI